MSTVETTYTFRNTAMPRFLPARRKLGRLPRAYGLLFAAGASGLMWWGIVRGVMTVMGL